MSQNFSSPKIISVVFTPLILSICSFFMATGQATASNQLKQSSPSIICESKDGRIRRCNFDTRRGVVLARQLSNSSCRGNWTYGRGYIEVRNGCRAEFIQGRNNNPSPRPPQSSQSIICDSHNGRVNRCSFDTRNGVVLIRQLSNSTCRGNWTYGRGYIEVRNGCRAKFARGRN